MCVSLYQLGSCGFGGIRIIFCREVHDNRGQPTFSLSISSLGAFCVVAIFRISVARVPM